MKDDHAFQACLNLAQSQFIQFVCMLPMASVFVCQFVSTQVTQRIVNHNTQTVTKANILTRSVNFKEECPCCIIVVIRLSMFPESLMTCHGHVVISIVHLLHIALLS